MNQSDQPARAEKFRALHYDTRLLVLPNVWNPLGARLLESLGYPAVATASAAIAYSLGVDDGECIEFDLMLEIAERIARSVSVPVTADIERGYSDTPAGVKENVRRVIAAGIVGINMEDSTVEGGPLRAVEDQRQRIEAARQAAVDAGVPIVINARIDTFLEEGDHSLSERVDEAISRAKVYIEAGADCIYPILLGDIEALASVREETGAPINAYLPSSAVPLRRLQEAGISRVSLGPGMLYTSFTAMKRLAEGLLRNESYATLTSGNLPVSEVHDIVSRGAQRGTTDAA